MSDITIRHTRADGTLIEGSRKGDGVYDVLRGLGGNWRYFPSLRQIGMGQSRDKAARTWHIERAAEALRNAGHEVTVTIDDTEARSFAEAEQERYERAERRADWHAEHAGKAAAASDAAWQAEHGILDMIPMGQPILVGHHSERRHRRDLDRAENLRRRGMAEQERSEYHADRAETAEKFQARRESVPTTLRRIEKLEAERRLWQRGLDGEPGSRTLRNRETDAYVPAHGSYLERVKLELEQLDEQLAYWRDVVAKAQAGGVKVWSRDDFTKGDYVLFLGTWYEVIRVSAKSVTIPAMINDGPIVHKDGNRCTWTDTVPYHKVKGRKSAEDIAAILAGVERREAEQATA
jgi:Domain of unknown function (DUF3560)